MTKRAVIAGSLTDIRNLGAHKMIKLTVEVPAELAQGVLDAFGWPTAVAPVPVALARMANSEHRLPERSLAQQAGALCKSPIFWAFMQVESEEACAKLVRALCGVESRSEIKTGTTAGDNWLDLLGEFHGWEAAEKTGATE